MSDQFLSALKAFNWHVVPAASPVTPHERLQALPSDLRSLLTAFDLIANQQETQWLVTGHLFSGSSAGDFRWNEFECLSLAAAQGDEAWSSEISEFWRKHVPVFMSVKDGYEYVAYCREGLNCGSYVFGREPEFEEVEAIAANTTEFEAWLISIASR